MVRRDINCERSVRVWDFEMYMNDNDKDDSTVGIRFAKHVCAVQS